MAQLRTLQKSFNAGEMSPEMFGRIDDAKYQIGAAKMRNFIPKPQGPCENRAGFAFVREVKDSTKATRLIPFTYSTTQTMVIEVGGSCAVAQAVTATTSKASITLAEGGIAGGDRDDFGLRARL